MLFLTVPRTAGRVSWSSRMPWACVQKWRRFVAFPVLHLHSHDLAQLYSTKCTNNTHIHTIHNTHTHTQHTQTHNTHSRKQHTHTQAETCTRIEQLEEAYASGVAEHLPPEREETPMQGAYPSGSCWDGYAQAAQQEEEEAACMAQVC